MQYTKRDPEFDNKLKFAGKPISPGFYVVVFRKENEALAAQFDAAIKRLRDNGTLRKIYEKWDLWNEDQAALDTGKLEQTLHTSATNWTFRILLSATAFRSRLPDYLLGGAAMTVCLTVLGFLLAMAIGLPRGDRPALRPGAAPLAGDRLRRILPRHSRPLAALLPLLQPAGLGRGLALARFR